VGRVRHSRWIAAWAVAAALVCGATGCDRGSHPGQIDGPAPDFKVSDGTKTVHLADYRGKVVVLNFWASWCPPCLEEFPSLIQLQRTMPNVVVLAVSFDHDAEAYREYLADNHIDLLTVLDTSEASNRAYGTTRPPETFIIDRKGVIRRKFIGPADWMSPEIRHYLSVL
jgi:cytochrome c biogenesis protein CcmG/thiol:disulfide interchange protein DsbE